MNRFDEMLLHYQFAVLIIVFFALYHSVRGLYKVSQILINNQGTGVAKLLCVTGVISLMVVLFMDLNHELHSALIFLTGMQFLISIALYLNHLVSQEIDDQGRVKRRKTNGVSTMDIYDTINQKVAMVDGVYAYIIQSIAGLVDRIRKR